MPSRICRSIEAMKAQIYSLKNIIKMTKLEMASELLPLIEKAHKKGVDIDLYYTDSYISITKWENDIIVTTEREIKVTDKRTFDKAINYLKSL